ncbi:peptidase S8 [Amycolatopsis sp. NPDC023774]|uniref:S53 family peptidase n=1 Tax=Amycolatopsis sp. NPDC023774 TaxID=3155015 RepID=UPI0033C619AD
MGRSVLRRMLGAAAVVVAVAGGLTTGSALAGTPDVTAPAAAPDSAAAVDACAVTTAPNRVRCQAKVRPGSSRKAAALDTPNGSAALPEGYGPADLQSAYSLSEAIDAGAGGDKTVAIVDAFDDPTAEADLAVYRSTYGLPPCTTANGCFRKVNEWGESAPLPPVDGGWSVEVSLDLDAVSAACPACHILLVEAAEASVNHTATAEDTAVALGADAVSNSYTVPESGSVLGYASSYNHPGVAITAATGDAGYQLVAPFPADLTSVTAVGGTTLTRTPGRRGWSETAWAANGESGAGSGCSALIDKPSWQHDRACPGRTIGDVSAAADPATGYAVYDTTPNPIGVPSGWMLIGGTSAATPLIAGIYALAGHTESVRDASGRYARAGEFHDVVGGNTSMPGTFADCPVTSSMCTALPGYDAPTGVGTPNGISGF